MCNNKTTPVHPFKGKQMMQRLGTSRITSMLSHMQGQGSGTPSREGSCVDRQWTGAVFFGLIITQMRRLLTLWPLSLCCACRADFKYWVAPLCSLQLRVQKFQIGGSASARTLPSTDVNPSLFWNSSSVWMGWGLFCDNIGLLKNDKL